MLILKGCQRCKGDMMVDRDHYGWYVQCLQCGYQRDLDSADKASPPVEAKK